LCSKKGDFEIEIIFVFFEQIILSLVKLQISFRNMLWGRFISGCWRNSDGIEERKEMSMRIGSLVERNLQLFLTKIQRERKTKENTREKF
jgi:hypothetical protein